MSTSIGAVLTTLKETYPELLIHALIRKQAHELAVRAAGASRVSVNASNDRALLRRLVSESDIIINVADGLDVDLANDLIEGLKTKKEKGGNLGTLIHVSGTLVFSNKNKEGRWDPNVKAWTVRASVLPKGAIRQQFG